MRRRLLLTLLATVVLAGSPSHAAPAPQIEISENARLLTSVPIRWAGDFTAGSLAAEGRYLFVGSPGSGRALVSSNPLRHGGFLVYRLTAGPPYAQQVAAFACPSSQEGGLTVWDGLLVQSVDPVDPLSNLAADTQGTCEPRELLRSGGLRVVDVRNPARPQQVDVEPLVCGARNHALVPSGRAGYLYTLKDACHESVASVDLGSTRLRVLKLERTAAGSDLRLVAQISLPAAVECHGWAVHTASRRAVCYGRSRLALFDISDPANPALVGLGAVPGETFYGAAITPDGRRLITASAASVDECSGSDDTVGVVRTFRVRDLTSEGSVPRVLAPRGSFSIPRVLTAQQPGGSACSSTSVTIIPGRGGKAFAAIGWNTGGLAVLDVTAERPREVAHFASKFDAPSDPQGASLFSGIRRAVWYQGRVYAPELMDRLGLRVLEIRGLGLHDMAPQPRTYNPQTVGG